ncbi:MAG: sulfotransferase domain-containing protein [Cryomorphaceae bacterium]
MYFTNEKEGARRLPDFIIPGAAKSGTTTLYQQLTAHPEIFFPKERKEPFYFSFGGEEPKYDDKQFNTIPIWDTDEYLNLYNGAHENQKCGDASTSYLYTHEASIANMKKLYGDNLRKVKIIILLRNPIERAYSHYTYLIRNGFENRPFAEAISEKGIAKWKTKRWGFDYLRYGEYSSAVSAFLAEFDNVEIFLTEDLKETDSILSKVCNFLEISEISDTREVVANPSGIPKNKALVNVLRKNRMFKTVGRMLPEKTKLRAQAVRDNWMSKLLTREPMSAESRRFLVDHYSKEIETLASLIGRDLSKWR